MPNPLLDLDGARKHIFDKGDQKFFLRVITSKDYLAQRRDVLEMIFSDFMIDAQEDLEASLKGEKLLDMMSEEEIRSRGLNPREFNHFNRSSSEKKEDDIQEFLDGWNESRTIFVVEDEGEEPVSIISITINDQSRREKLRAEEGVKRAEEEEEEGVKTFVYVEDVVTAKAHRGGGIFSSAFDKVLTMLANPKRESGMTQYVISVTAATAINDEDRVTNHVLNLPAYFGMWKSRGFSDLSLIKRHEKIDGNDDVFAVGEPIKIPNQTLGTEEVHDFVEQDKEELREAGGIDKVRGVYLSGVAPEYLTSKVNRKVNRNKPKSQIQRNKSEEKSKSSWQLIVGNEQGGEGR